VTKRFGSRTILALTEEIIHSLENFTRGFQKEGLADIEAAARAVKPDIDCFEFSILN
jgi:hypothetical protein